MFRVALKLLLAGAAVAAVWCFVPFGGRTLADRWAAASDPSDFVDRTWAEMKGAPARPRPPARPQARNSQPRERTSGRPSEGHTDSDRRALDRIVSDHVRE